MSIIYLLLVIVSILILWNFLWQKLSVDILREDLFKIRHELLILGYENKEFNYKTTLYGDFENLINGTIRFAENIRLTQYVFFSITWRLVCPDVKIQSKFENDYQIFINQCRNKELKDR